ncbi:MAG: alpha/beta fold hydrolase [Ekhidna sp.]
MKLNFRKLGEGQPLIILHGVFGSSDNWQTLGKIFADTFKVYLVDLRNHGNSPHSDEFTYEAMMRDVVELMDDEGIERAHVLGHSMGGKVAMHVATHHSERMLKLIVVDIAPKYYPPHHQQIFDGFHSVDLASLESRKDAESQMSKVISNMGVRLFILKNLHRDKDGKFSWKLNVDAIEKAIEEVGGSIEEGISFDGETLFIGGGKSDYISDEDHSLIKSYFPEAKIETVPAAGHWVHAEKPDELSKLVLSFLQ